MRTAFPTFLPWTNQNVASPRKTKLKQKRLRRNVIYRNFPDLIPYSETESPGLALWHLTALLFQALLCLPPVPRKTAFRQRFSARRLR